MEKEYKVYASQAKCAYSGYSLIAAECATRANEIIQEFQDEDTDNNFDSWGYEIIDLLIGDTDIAIDYGRINPKLENLMDSDKMYNVTKPLTSKEKLAVFLCDICGYSCEKAAIKMNYQNKSSVYRLLQNANKKIEENYKKENK